MLIKWIEDCGFLAKEKIHKYKTKEDFEPEFIKFKKDEVTRVIVISDNQDSIDVQLKIDNKWHICKNIPKTRFKIEKGKKKTIELDISGTITLDINVDWYNFPKDIQEILSHLKVVGNEDIEITKTIIDGYSVYNYRDFPQH